MRCARSEALLRHRDSTPPASKIQAPRTFRDKDFSVVTKPPPDVLRVKEPPALKRPAEAGPSSSRLVGRRYGLDGRVLAAPIQPERDSGGVTERDDAPHDQVAEDRDGAGEDGDEAGS